MPCHIRKLLFLWFLLVLFTGLGPAQERRGLPTVPATEVANPYTKPEDLEQGALVVRAFCSTCHGRDGTGGRGPDLTRGHFRHGNSDEALFRNIRNGIPGTGMPGMRLSELRTWQAISFLRAKGSRPEPPVLQGNAKEGEKLFGKYNCASCHWTGHAGGRRGSDLSRSGGTPDYVKAAILEPNADLDPKYQRVLVYKKDGRVLEGVRLNENGYHVQLIDDRDELWTIATEDIEELHKPNQSLMPSYATAFTQEQLADLVAYLFSLRKE
jgi:putative heme-binding domain-containing protein